MSLSEQIKEQADTIEMLSGQRPVGVRLTRKQYEQLSDELDALHISLSIGGWTSVHGIDIEVIDDNTRT